MNADELHIPDAAEEVRRAYTERYSPAQLELQPTTPYDRHMIDIRNGLIRSYGDGKDVLDLGCGSGAYLVPHLHLFRSAIGVDFSPVMLEALRRKLQESANDGKVQLLEEDARSLSIPGDSVDLAYSFSSLYYVPDVSRALSEVHRVLRPGGLAILDLGNVNSLNALVSRQMHKESGWARSYLHPYSELRRLVQDRFEIEAWRCFQLLPMYGVTRRLRPLYPLLAPQWKRLLGVRLRGKMLDERVSSSILLRRLAFRHLVVARKL